MFSINHSVYVGTASHLLDTVNSSQNLSAQPRSNMQAGLSRTAVRPAVFTLLHADHAKTLRKSSVLFPSYCPSSIQGQTRQFYSLKTLTPPLLSLAPLLPLSSPCCHSFGPGSAIPSRSPCSNFPLVSLCLPEALPSTKTVRSESPPSVSPAHPDSLFTVPAHLPQCSTPSPLLLSIPVPWNHYTQCSEGLALPSLCHSVQATCPLYQEHFLL